MGVKGSELLKWGQNGPNTLGTYLMYLFLTARASNKYIKEVPNVFGPL